MRSEFSRAFVLFAAALLAACAAVVPPRDSTATLALAPTGKLRVAVYPGSPTSLVRDPDGQTRGVALDLGRAMAGGLGVPFEMAEFRNNAEALEAVKEGRADFAFTNATPARMKDMDFSPALMGVEQGYIVPAGSSIRSVADVDRAGVRVGVSKASSSERELTTLLKAATLVPAPTLAAGRQMLAEGKIEAYATNKAILKEMSAALPGSRILDGRYGLESFAIGVPRGREAGHGWLRSFAERARSDGTVDKAIDRAGLRGAASQP